MSTLRLTGSTSGYTEVTAPAVAGSNTLVLPGGNGTADQALVTNGSGTLSFADRGRMVLSTAQNSTSGTSIDFTGIPSWVKRVTVMFDGVSTNGTSFGQIQLGDSGGVENTGYTSQFSADSSTSAVMTTGLGIFSRPNAAYGFSGLIQIANISGNTWASSGALAFINVASVCWTSAGSKTLSATLDRVRITTVNGTDTFDAGTINILMEG